MKRYVCSSISDSLDLQFDGQKKMFDRVNRADVEIWCLSSYLRKGQLFSSGRTSL